ncbi:serine/threonine-protein kinase Rck2p [Trichomonascus vanleenenianus]|uniref:serine/threonine-protein kinase n=1 Tax=Trichomonascus vanleenenianus TaxID=2268995 RepID=UPI003ECAF0BB
MPVFENLKNFIRHGKQAAYSPSAQLTHFGEPTAHHQAPSPHVDEKHRKEYYNDAAKQIIAEENEERSKLPQYPGLTRFQLLEKLGDGAFSVVYKALDVQTNRHVAVKVIRKQDLSSSQRSSILKEVAIMRQLRHKNIVNLIDFSESPDYYFIVLELIPGGELFHQIVRLTYFSEDLSRHVILQVAEAIRYLHEEAGVVHRDIKPENLLFYPIDFVPSKVKVVRKGEDAEAKEDEGEFIPGTGAGGIGTIKLADFGLSKIIWDSKTMTPCGTVGYTAPEIVKDERYSKSVDMWALGCVLYTVLCGFPPFYDESIEVLTEKVATGQYTFLSPWWDEISKPAKDLVSHLLTVDPERRYTITEFLNHPWITQSNEPTAPSVDAPRAAERATRQNRQPVIPPTPGAVAPPQQFVAPLPAAAQPPQTQHIQAQAPQLQVFSPAAVTLKEVFDVSNAVHRMEEENARTARRRGAVFMDGVDTLVEANEGNSAGATAMEGVQRNFERVSMGNTSPAEALQRKPRNGGGMFELHLEGATLLERRKKNQQMHQQQPQQLAQ